MYVAGGRSAWKTVQCTVFSVGRVEAPGRQQNVASHINKVLPMSRTIEFATIDYSENHDRIEVPAMEDRATQRVRQFGVCSIGW